MSSFVFDPFAVVQNYGVESVPSTESDKHRHTSAVCRRSSMSTAVDQVQHKLFLSRQSNQKFVFISNTVGFRTYCSIIESTFINKCSTSDTLVRYCQFGVSPVNHSDSDTDSEMHKMQGA